MARHVRQVHKEYWLIWSVREFLGPVWDLWWVLGPFWGVLLCMYLVLVSARAVHHHFWPAPPLPNPDVHGCNTESRPTGYKFTLRGSTCEMQDVVRVCPDPLDYTEKPAVRSIGTFVLCDPPVPGMVRPETKP